MDCDKNVLPVICYHFYRYQEIQCAQLAASPPDVASKGASVLNEKCADAVFNFDLSQIFKFINTVLDFNHP